MQTESILVSRKKFAPRRGQRGSRARQCKRREEASGPASSSMPPGDIDRVVSPSRPRASKRHPIPVCSHSDDCCAARRRRKRSSSVRVGEQVSVGKRLSELSQVQNSSRQLLSAERRLASRVCTSPALLPPPFPDPPRSAAFTTAATTARARAICGPGCSHEGLLSFKFRGLTQNNSETLGKLLASWRSFGTPGPEIWRFARTSKNCEPLGAARGLPHLVV